NGAAPLRQRAVGIAARLAVIALPVVAYFCMSYRVLGAALLGGPDRLALGYGLRMIPKVLIKYLGLAVLPSGYTIEHVTAPAVSLLGRDFILPALIIAVMITIVTLSRARLLYFASVWFVVWLAPMLAAVRTFSSVNTVLERQLYLPSVGVCLTVALGMDWVAARLPLTGYKPMVATAIISLLVILLTVIRIGQNAVWKDDLSLYKHYVDVSPETPLAHTELSAVYAGLGQLDDAKNEAQSASNLDSTCIEAYMNLSYLANLRGDSNTAIDYLKQGKLQVADGPLRDSQLATLSTDLAALYQTLKEYSLAEQNLTEAAKLQPDSPGIWEQFGQLVYEQGRYAEALEMFRKALPGTSRGYALIHRELGETYDHLGDQTNAKREYEAYLDRAFNEPDAEKIRARLRQM
ncbi:MAG TPA: hypothetical protein VJX67_13875, partial [Blastocatellia bacterium]|nr:hypothetical protein [Blastocatellia bacterium]